MTTHRRNRHHRSSRLDRGVSRRTALGHLGAGLAAGIGLSNILRLAPNAAAQDSSPSAAMTDGPAAAHRVSVGQIEVLVLDDGASGLPAGFMAVNAPEEALAEGLAVQGLTPADAIPVSYHPLLVETGGQRVLLDTGNGPFDPAAGKLLAALDAEGIAPEEIDVVLLTHMHFDHFGAVVTDSGGLVFPNARHLINDVEYEFWWAEPNLDELTIPDEFKQLFRQGAKDVLTVLEPTVEKISPGDEIAPGLSVVDARGHTPGQLAVEISSDDERALHVVDAAIVPTLHLENPDWFLASDNWPAWSIATRKALLDRAADEDLLVLTYHFPFPGIGRVTKDAIGWIWTPQG